MQYPFNKLAPHDVFRGVEVGVFTKDEAREVFGLPPFSEVGVFQCEEGCEACEAERMDDEDEKQVKPPTPILGIRTLFVPLDGSNVATVRYDARRFTYPTLVRLTRGIEEQRHDAVPKFLEEIRATICLPNDFFALRKADEFAELPICHLNATVKAINEDYAIFTV